MAGKKRDTRPCANGSLFQRRCQFSAALFAEAERDVIYDLMTPRRLMEKIGRAAALFYRASYGGWIWKQPLKTDAIHVPSTNVQVWSC